MNNNLKAIREGALMIALSAVLLLVTWYLPMISVGGIFICGVPMACMAARNRGKFTIIAAVGVFLVTFLITMNIFAAVLLFLMSVLPGMVAGWCLGKRTNFFTTLLITCIFVAIGWLVEVYSINKMIPGGLDGMVNEILVQVRSAFDMTLKQFPKELLRAEELTTAIDLAIEEVRYMMKLYMPAIVVISSVVSGYIILRVCGFFIGRLRLADIEVLPFNMLKAPRGMSFLAVVLYLISIFVKKEGSYYAVSANIIMILYVIIGICGLSLIDYLFSKVVRQGPLRGLIYGATFMLGGMFFNFIGTALVIAGLIDSSNNFRRIQSDEDSFGDFNGGEL